MVVGPFALLPLSHAIGRTSTIFWSTLLVMVCNIWAASMTKSSQYAPYLVSRFFAGFGGTVPAALGPRILLDLFFIHERGRAFSVFTLSYLLGTLAVPTVGCFVASQTHWPIMFWWTIPFLGLALILTVAFMEETGFERDGQTKYPRQPKSFVANRIATFLPGSRVVPNCTLAETVSPTFSGRNIMRLLTIRQVDIFVNCLILMVTPVSLAIGLYGLISYGAALMQATMQATFLLEPVKDGGYGFELLQLAEGEYQQFKCFVLYLLSSPDKPALVSISGWIGILAAFIYTQLVSDRVPIWICRKHGGIWKNEYRLQCMWFPGLIVLPIGLGLFGVSVKNHWNPAMLALSYFMTMFGANAATSIISNYLSESFPQFPAECGIFLSAYRLILGLASGFFIQPWAGKVGVAWTFGTAAFLSAFAFLFIILLLWKGPAIRQIKLTHSLSPSNEGSKLML